MKRDYLSEFFLTYPELKRVHKDVEARNRGFRDASEFRTLSARLTIQQRERWADGTKEELLAIWRETET